jgi:DNA-binding NarL/FixJ family response regulator
MRGEKLPAGLTTREVDVLVRLASGLSSKKIGEVLFVSERTVERHIANIYSKTGAHGRADATAWAIRQGLLEGYRADDHEDDDPPSRN